MGQPPWVLYNLTLPLDTPCPLSSILRETLCALKCLAFHKAGLLATFVLSLANGTVRKAPAYPGASVAALVAPK